MMIGGIPYYLERVDPTKGFIHTVKKILASLGQDGSSQATIIAKTGLPASTVRELIEKLLDYEIIFPKNYLRILKKNRSGEKYFMKDFLMNFYFQILRKSSESIKLNEQDFIFPLETGLSPKGYYLPNFTGKAFELFLRILIESKEVLNVPLGQKMLLKDPNLKVMDYADSQVQIDLIVETKGDRSVTGYFFLPQLLDIIRSFW